MKGIMYTLLKKRLFELELELEVTNRVEVQSRCRIVISRGNESCRRSVEVTHRVDVQLRLILRSGNDVAKIYIQIENSEKRWRF